MTPPTRLEREVARLNQQAVATRATLVQLQRDVATAEARLRSAELGDGESVRLREANEQLVLASLRASGEAENARRSLHVVSRSAERDPITGLPNRVVLLDNLTRAIAAASRSGMRLALLFVDLDDFRRINDTLGHVAGDRILRRVAHRLLASVRPMDTVSRHAGNAFLVLLPEVSRPSDATTIAAKMSAALAAPTCEGGHPLRLSASIGISHFPDDGTTADTLIDRADLDMYRIRQLRDTRLPSAGAAAPGLAVSTAPLTASAADDDTLRLAQLRDANEALVFAALTAQAKQASAEKVQARQTDILGVVAHELRNPLPPMLQAAAALTRSRMDSRLLQQVQGIIQRQVGHIGRLVQDLLDVSRVATGKLRLDCGAIEVAALLAEAVDTLRSALDLRQQHLAVSVPPDVPPIHADRMRLLQVVSNLLDNASKYTPVGGTIRLAVTANPDTLVITVSDDGIGIEASVLPTIFEAFVQAGRATRFSGAGMGIGLTLVRELVEAHGGAVTASSEGVGLGSRFVVTLPLRGPPTRTAP
jgi:diguanylate cyclase (GGDEF)-like protein